MSDKRDREPSTASDMDSPSASHPAQKQPKMSTSPKQDKEGDAGLQEMFQQIIRGQEQIRRSLESKIDRLRNEIKTDIDLKVKKLRDDFELGMSKMEADIEKLGKRLWIVEQSQAGPSSMCGEGETDAETRYAYEMPPVKQPFATESTVVVTGLYEEESEELTAKVIDMLEIMEVGHIKPVNCLRLKSNIKSRPGLIKVEFHNKEEKIEVLRAKYKLKDVSRFKRVYVRGSKTHAERIIDHNARTLLKQMPNGHLYRIAANGKIVPKNMEGRAEQEDLRPDARRNGAQRRGYRYDHQDQEDFPPLK
jgi:hypothetical protein